MDLDELSSLLAELGSPHAYFVQSIASHVYHYTDLNALRQIVAAQDLWLTDSRYSNDTEELSHGHALAERVIADRVAATTTAEERRFLRKVSRSLAESRELGVYVCCFCLADDLLGQWRSYGANGTGVSLRMTTSQFEIVSGPDMPPAEFGLIYLWRVFYDVEQQRRLIDDCLRLSWSRSLADARKVELATDALRFFMPTFKNQDFSQEQEARLVFIPAPTCPVMPEFRAARGMLIPYFSLRKLADAAMRSDWRVPIESVRIGPSDRRHDNRRSTELFLRTNGYTAATVETSATPYRA